MKSQLPDDLTIHSKGETLSRFILVHVLLLLAAIWCLVDPEHVAQLLTFWSKDPDWPHLKGFMQEVGTALLIAFILSLTIESFNRQRHAGHLLELDARHKALKDALGEDLLAEVYKRQVPQEVFCEVERDLLKADFYRLKINMQLTLERLHKSIATSAPAGLVMVTEDYYCKVRNISGERKRAPLRTSATLLEGLNGLAGVSFARVGSKVLTREQIKASTTITENLLSFDFTDAQPLAPGDTLEQVVVIHYVRPERAEYVHVSLKPSSGYELSIVDPDMYFKVMAESVHTQPLTPTSNPSSPVLHKWVLSSGVFPGQGLWCFWEPKNSPCPVPNSSLDKVTEEVQSWVDRTNGQKP